MKTKSHGHMLAAFLLHAPLHSLANFYELFCVILQILEWF